MTNESRIRMVTSLALGIALLLLAGGSQAQQRHPLKLSGLAFQQDLNLKTGDAFVSKGKFTEKWLAAFCLGEFQPQKDHVVTLMLESPCGDVNANQIQVVQKESLAVVDTLGSIELDFDFMLRNEKKGVLSNVVVPMTIQFECVSEIIDMDVETSAVATIGMDASGDCVETIKAQNGSGAGIINEDPTIFDRAKFGAKKPDDSLSPP
ncbi:MAG: hypothetical protein ABFS41_09450 [Myxococcota bacterium]